MKQQVQPSSNILQNLIFEPSETEQLKLHTYHSYFSIENRKQIEKMRASLLSLLSPQIKYDQQGEFVKKLTVKIIKHSSNYEFIDVQAKLGHFIFQKISIFTMGRASLTHEVQDNDSGNFCTVYRCQCKGISLAFKCFLKQKLVCKQGTLLERVIQEYCILKIASALQTGPKLYDILGYDIIVYPQCIQFSMEACELMNSGRLNNSRIKGQTELKENLLKLHAVNVIHHDIKMDNICFSNAFKRFVFIDFGMGIIIKQKIGYKTFTYFKGSLHYCSEQMAQLFNLSDTGRLVDLYFNDLIGLQTTLHLIPNKDIYHNQEQTFYEQYQTPCLSFLKFSKNMYMKERKMQQFQMICYLKYNIFHNKQDYLQSILYKLSKEQIIQIFSFTLSMNFSRKIKKLNKYLFQIMKKQYDYSFDQPLHNPNQQQNQMLQTLSQINKINSHNLIEYFLNRFQTNFNELITLLKCKKQVEILDAECYQCLLSKVIQFNATQLPKPQLETISQIALQIYKKDALLKEIIAKYTNEQNNRMLIISQFLLKKSLANQLKGRYFQIFSFIINNILAFQIINDQDIINLYSNLLQISLPFQKKIMIIIKFHQTLIWVKFIRFRMQKFNELKKKIDELSINFSNGNQSFNENQKICLRSILQKQKNIPFQQVPQISKEQKYQLLMWNTLCKMDELYLKENIQQQFIEYDNQLRFYQANMVQPYHLYFFLFFIIHKKQTKLDQFVTKYKKILRNHQQNNSFVNLVEGINNLWQNNYNKIQISNFIKSLQNQQFFENPILKYIIEFQFTQIFNIYRNNFSKCKEDTRRLFFNVWYLACSYQSAEQLPLKSCFRQLTNSSFKKFVIQTKYFNHFGKNLTICNKIQQNVKIYLSLTKQLYQIPQLSNQLLLECNFSLLILLIIKGRHKYALQLSKILYKMTYFISNSFINKESILQFIFYYVQNDQIPDLNKNTNIKKQLSQLNPQNWNKYSPYNELKVSLSIIN